MFVSEPLSYKFQKAGKQVGVAFVSYGVVALVSFVLFAFQLRFEQMLGITFTFAILFFFLVFVSFRVGLGQGLFAAFFLTLLSFLSQVDKNGYFTREDVLQSVAFSLFALSVGIIQVLQKQSEESARTAARYYHTLIDKDPHPLVLTDRTGIIFYASKAIKHLLRFEPKELIDKHISVFVIAQDRDQCNAFIKTVSQDSSNHKTIEFRMRRRNISWLWVRSSAVSLLHDDAVRGIMLTFRDVAEQKNIDAQRIRSLAREKKARSLAVQAVRARDEFLSIASHELKTPLTTIILKLQSTLRSTLSQTLANFSGERLVASLTVAEEQSQRLAKLIGDLLNVSLISTGRIKLELKRVDLREIVTSALKHLEEQLKNANCQLAYTANTSITGLWDEVRIEQAISNLINNSINYGAGKPIEVRVIREGKFALVSITDHGKGIKQAYQKIIFERFRRVGTKDNKGLGIGLFIVEQITSAHGGSVDVKSSPGKGATFTLRLPIKEGNY